MDKNKKIILKLSSVESPLPNVELFSAFAENIFCDSSRMFKNIPPFINDRFLKALPAVIISREELRLDIDDQNDLEPIFIKYTSNGLSCIKDEKNEICYSEPSSGELVGAETSIAFDAENKNSILISRRGKIKNDIFLSESVLFGTDYPTSLGVFRMRAYTLRIKNGVKNGKGIIILDYIAQLEGCEAQRVKMRIEIKDSAGIQSGIN